MKKNTLVVGASTKPGRISGSAVARLRQAGHPVTAVGRTPGSILDVALEKELPEPLLGDFDTVTLYLAPENQEEISSWLLKALPKRVIFNPGTENETLMQDLKSAGVDALEACTLVMLASQMY